MADKEKKDHYFITGLFVSKCQEFEANNGRKPKFGEKMNIAKRILKNNKMNASVRALLLAIGIGVGATAIGAGTQPTEQPVKTEQEGQAPSQENEGATQGQIVETQDNTVENEAPAVEYHDSSSGQFFEPGEQKQALKDIYQFMKDNGILNETASIEPEDYKMYASTNAQLSIVDIDGNGRFDENIDKIISSYNMSENTTVDYGTNAPENAIPFQYNGYVIYIVNPNTNEVIASTLHGEPTTFNYPNIENMGHYQNIETKGAYLGGKVLKGSAKQFDSKEYSNLYGPFDRIWQAQLMEINERLEKQGNEKITEPVLGQQKNIPSYTPTPTHDTATTEDIIAGFGSQGNGIIQNVEGTEVTEDNTNTTNNPQEKTNDDDDELLM